MTTRHPPRFVLDHWIATHPRTRLRSTTVYTLRAAMCMRQYIHRGLRLLRLAHAVDTRPAGARIRAHGGQVACTAESLRREPLLLCTMSAILPTEWLVPRTMSMRLQRDPLQDRRIHFLLLPGFPCASGWCLQCPPSLISFLPLLAARPTRTILPHQ